VTSAPRTAGGTRPADVEAGATVTDRRERNRGVKTGVEIESVGAALLELTGPVQVSDQTFEVEVIRSPLPVVVDFYADWSVPCRLTHPVFVDLSNRLAGRVKFVTANIDESTRVTRSYGIHAVPTYLFLDSGQEKGREVGPLGAVEFRTALRRCFHRRPVVSGGTPATP
jgi:thioredoxin 1